jgi:hypothetical protein
VAIRLQFDTIIIPRAHFARCRNLPAFFSELHVGGGILFEVNWYDAQLWCETAMSESREIVASWEERGLSSGMPPRPAGAAQWKWRDLCVAASGRGPYGGCDWLEFDPADNCVWLKGTAKGAVIGGRMQFQEESEKLAALREKAEDHYTAMHGTPYPKDDYEDACSALSQAGRIAAFLHQPDVAEELKQREAHISKVFNSQFRRSGPL